MKRNAVSLLYTAAITLLVCFLALPLHAADDVSVTATVDKTEATLEDYILLQVSVKGMRAEPRLAGVADFSVKSRGSSSQVSIVNGRMTSSVEYTYLLFPQKAGTFTIGPASVEHDGKDIVSNRIALVIAAAGARGNDDERALFVTAEVDNKSPYLYEQIVYTFKFYRRVKVSNARLSESPDFEGFLGESLGKEKEYQKVINGQAYVVTELRHALTPAKTGVLTIGASTLECDVIVQNRSRSRRRGFFNDPFFNDPFFGFSGQAVPKTLRTQPLTVMVQPLPKSGKPPGFANLVGDFTLQASLNEKTLAVGESTTLTLTLSGSGNLKSLKDIDIGTLQNFKLYGDKPVFEQKLSGDRVGGILTVKKALVPLVDGALSVPAVQVSYFSPSEKRYKTASAGPFAVQVRPAKDAEKLQALAPAQQLSSKEAIKVLGHDILPVYAGLDVLTPASAQRITLLQWTLLALPLMLFAAVMILRTVRDRDQADSSRARARGAWRQFAKQLPALQKLVKKDDARFYADAARALREYVGDKLGAAGSALTPAEIVARLKETGVDETGCNRVKQLLEGCDAGQYGFTGGAADEKREMLKEITGIARLLNRTIKR